MRDMKNDELIILITRSLAELLRKKSEGCTLSEEEGVIGEAAIEVLPPSTTFFCSTCAASDISHQALEGFLECKEHVRERFRQEPPFPPGNPIRLRTPKTQQETTDEETEFVNQLLAQKRMGNPLSVEEKKRAHSIAARAHLVADARSFSHDELCPECKREGVSWPACEGFRMCHEHLHEAIDARVRMT